MNGNPITVKTQLEMNLSSFSLEGHARYYPFGETFFLDAMLGYARLSASFEGDLVGRESTTNQEEAKHVSLDAARNYFKVGARVGWRISFGKNGGFTFEPAIGYSAGIGMGDTIGKQLTEGVKADVDTGDLVVDTGNFDEIFKYIESYIFAGGPRATFAFGYRF